MDNSMPLIPPFGIKEPGFVFALWLRDKLYRNDELKRHCAQLLGVSVETITHWTREASARPTFDSAMTLLWALEGNDEFWTRLGAPEGGMASQINGVLAALESAERRAAHHPPQAELDAALDGLLEVQARAAALAQMIRKATAARAEEIATTPPRLVPRDAG